MAARGAPLEKLAGLPMQVEEFRKQPGASISQPQEVGSFSLTGPSASDEYGREYHDDRRGLAELQRRGPQQQALVKGLALPLDKGFHSWVLRKEAPEPAQREHLDHLLTWILRHPDEFLLHRPTTDIVCWRGHLHTVMVTPYESGKFCSGWIVSACKMDGVIYLSHFDTPAKAAEKDVVDEQQAHFCYWGYKFEQYMTHAASDKAAFNEPVNNYNAFQSVLKTRVGRTGLLFGAEMDCVDPLKKDSVPAPQCYVELKTTRRPDTDRQWRTLYDNKMRKVWAQSYISGVPTILIGYRDDQGNCTRTEEIPTDRISAAARDYGNNWSGAICLNFLDGFLELVKRTVREDYREAVYKFEWNPGWDRVTAEKWQPQSQWKFMPDWYVEKRPR